MEDLLENGIPQNPEEASTASAADSKVAEDKVFSEPDNSEKETHSTEDSDTASGEKGSKVVEITPQSIGVNPQRVKRNFSVRMKVTNDCIIVTVMRVDSDDTLTFVNNIRW